MKKKEKHEIRLPVLEKFKPVWLTSEAHQILREQKKKQGESMAQIVNNLILEKYGKNGGTNSI